MNNREVGIVTAIAYFICGCYLQVDVDKSREVMFNDINIWTVPAWGNPKGVSTRQRRGEGMQLPYSQYRGRNAGGY